VKRYDVAQGTAEWRSLRLGRPTASNFHKILTAGGESGKKAKISEQSTGYLWDLLGELMLGRPIDEVTTAMMGRGSMLEDRAVAYYELQRDVDTEIVGFCTTDDGRVGASPDRFIGEDGLLEIKCPSVGNHVGYLLFSTIEDRYRPQLQGQLYVTGRQWVDIVSYHPELPAAINRVKRDEDYIKLLAAALDGFCGLLDRERDKLREKDLLPEPEATIKLDEVVTDEELGRIMTEKPTPGTNNATDWANIDPA